MKKGRWGCLQRVNPRGKDNKLVIKLVSCGKKMKQTWEGKEQGTAKL